MPLPGVLLIVNMYNILLATGMGLMGLIVFGFEDVRRVVYCLCHAECGLRHGDGFQVCVRVKVLGWKSFLVTSTAVHCGHHIHTILDKTAHSRSEC